MSFIGIETSGHDRHTSREIRIDLLLSARFLHSAPIHRDFGRNDKGSLTGRVSGLPAIRWSGLPTILTCTPARANSPRG